ncbi:MAG: bifunctional riboflavin kinase/FAD synthetase [Congregibacter sp.]
MELLRGLSSLGPKQNNCVATIGAFDGVHLGHQAVIEQLAEQAKGLDLPMTVVTFEPLPREYLGEYLELESAPARLQSFRERYGALAALGVDRLLCLRFDESLRQMSAQDFASEIFVRGLGVRALVIGDDFRFGREREGGFTFMRELGEREGFSTLPTHTVELDGERISSTRLRLALANADFALARRMLNRDFEISGRVIYGKQLGRQLGVPTANLALRRRSVPLSGVFAVTVNGAELVDEPAIANVGTRPTVNDGQRPNLEVHILQGSPALYGQRLRVRFHKKLRDERRFDSIDELKTHIHRDIDTAREWFLAGNQENTKV